VGEERPRRWIGGQRRVAERRFTSPEGGHLGHLGRGLPAWWTNSPRSKTWQDRVTGKHTVLNTLSLAFLPFALGLCFLIGSPRVALSVPKAPRPTDANNAPQKPKLRAYARAWASRMLRDLPAQTRPSSWARTGRGGPGARPARTSRGVAAANARAGPRQGRQRPELEKATVRAASKRVAARPGPAFQTIEIGIGIGASVRVLSLSRQMLNRRCSAQESTRGRRRGQIGAALQRQERGRGEIEMGRTTVWPSEGGNGDEDVDCCCCCEGAKGEMPPGSVWRLTPWSPFDRLTMRGAC